MALASILAGTFLLPVAAAVGGIAAVKYNKSEEPYDPHKYSSSSNSNTSFAPSNATGHGHTRLLGGQEPNVPERGELTPKQMQMLQHQMYLQQQKDAYRQQRGALPHQNGSFENLAAGENKEPVPCGAVLRTRPISNDPSFAPEYPPGYNVPGTSYGPAEVMDPRYNANPGPTQVFMPLPGTTFTGGFMPDSEQYKARQRQEFILKQNLDHPMQAHCVQS